MALPTYFHSHFKASNSIMSFRLRSPLILGPEGSLQYFRPYSCRFGFKPNGIFRNKRPNFSCGVSMAAGQSDDPKKMNLDHVVNTARKFWDTTPQPVKSFPWNRALENFIQLILDIVLAVVKCLCVPVLAVTSLSEMSYCAHQKKLLLVVFPLLIGVAVAGILRETALEMSPLLKDAEVPWHLIAMAILFTLIKLPGPCYPYWLRIFIPHLANGVLWRTLWFAILWYRKSRKGLGENLQ